MDDGSPDESFADYLRRGFPELQKVGDRKKQSSER